MRDLNVIYDELEHGAELMFEEQIGISEDEVREMLASKSQLNVFCENQPRNDSKPNYGCKEILEEALKIMRHNAGENN